MLLIYNFVSVIDLERKSCYNHTGIQQAHADRKGDVYMLDINERLRSYEPLWDGWKKDAYLGGNSSSASFLMKLDAPEGRKYSLAIVLPMISFRDMPEDRSERANRLSRWLGTLLRPCGRYIASSAICSMRIGSSPLNW